MKVKNTEFKIIVGSSATLKTRKGFLNYKIAGPVHEQSVRLGFREIFQKAEKSKQHKVLFPAVGLIQGFPAIATAKIVSQEILRYCRAHPTTFKDLVLVLFSRADRALFEKQVYGYLHHVQEDLGCGPYVTVDVLIELKEGLVLIERTNPPFGLAIPGGFVDNFESVEAAARREAKEETNLELVNLRQFHVYSDPRRDPRFHTVSTAFIAQGKGKPQFGDDAKGLKVIPYSDLLKYPYAFDHGQIIRDYLKSKGR